MMNKWIYCVLLISTVLFSCEKELPYEGKGKKPLLVINAVLTNHESFSVSVSRSVFFLTNSGNASSAISDAEVTIVNVNAGTTHVISAGPGGNYFFPFDVEPNTTYKITVKHPKYPTATAEVTTVSDVVLDDVDTSSVMLNAGTKERIYVYNFQDLPGDNFYIVAFQRPVGDWNSEDTLYYDGIAYSNDACVESINTAISADKSPEPHLFFTDYLFKGLYKQLEIREERYAMGDTIQTGFSFTLANVSEDTYKYYKSIPKPFLTSNPFTDPIKVYSNITGGYGIFGSISYSIVEK